MKNVIVIGDGMAGYPIEELGGKTPLQVAEKPNLDWIASNGRNGLLKNVPEKMPADSDVAIMSILGYDPREYYTGRGPLEAAGMDIELEEGDVAFRCNLITMDDGFIKDYSGGHLSTEEAEELMEVVKKNFGNLGDFYVGVDYRHLFVLRNAKDVAGSLSCRAPHKIVGEKVDGNLIEPGSVDIAESLNRMMLESKEILSDHPINEKRVEEGKNPANAIWVWGQGVKPSLVPIFEKYGVRGAVISAVTLVKGLGVLAGMDKVDVPGVTGYYDTDYENKADYGLRSLVDHDLVLIHVEAPDEAGHSGDIEEKIRAIENLDNYIVGRFLDNLDEDFTVSVMADHPTPIVVRNHVSDPVPFSIYSTRGDKDNISRFDEFEARNGSFGTLEGYKFMDVLFSSF
ncbi:phosphoglycerate mutase [candidate division MSBL1 archaeon SCGC-AAA259M10]|uniref:2,3-bisphosphoglycerate-independent phosphoglycerate mutase n=2 Tax=candidate division MSBL1 TaxID=215777 RepID=A0A133V1L4_9EURY|nr:phosphoglycerate mutase [candidate division MSBL1 archaeon SCGC-AAA259E22]KXB00329.1 phosphoglycerate mutase [candidate division MSBL1 archaeon SCGC-AAA259M10]